MEVENGVKPVWAVGLKRSGLYYEGFVDNLEDTLHGGTSTMYYHHLWHQDFQEVTSNDSSP